MTKQRQEQLFIEAMTIHAVMMSMLTDPYGRTCCICTTTFQIVYKRSEPTTDNLTNMQSISYCREPTLMLRMVCHSVQPILPHLLPTNLLYIGVLAGNGCLANHPGL